MKKTIQASTFKAQCLRIMDEVKTKKRRVIITKRNEPIAEIIPIGNESFSPFGKMKGTIHIKGDIIQPIGEEWDADS
jgi:prevent-host-death family protein